MPMHDWSDVDAGLFHHFHQTWTAKICDALNTRLLPASYSALLARSEPEDGTGHSYPLKRANRITIRHRLSEVVCVIEIVSPGNKASRAALRQFLEKTLEFVRAGVNLLLVDPFPPGPRDPHSLHKLLWDEMVADVPFELPADEPLLLAAYRVGDSTAGVLPVAYLEPFRVRAALIDMPAWIDPDVYVSVPLERAYQAAWETCPADYRYLVEHGRLPDE